MCILLLEKPALGAWSWAEMKVVDLEEQLREAHCAVETEREQREITEKESATLRWAPSQQSHAAHVRFLQHSGRLATAPPNL